MTENDRLWRVAHALTGKNYKIPGSSNLQHFLLKRLLVEKSIDVIAPSNAFVCEMEETCISEPDLRFNIPKNMEESKVKFEYKPAFTAQSKRRQERQDEGHGGQDAFGNYAVTKLSELICELCVKEMQMNKSKVLGSNSKHFLRELLRKLECGHERCCEIKPKGGSCIRDFLQNAWLQSRIFNILWRTSTKLIRQHSSTITDTGSNCVHPGM